MKGILTETVKYIHFELAIQKRVASSTGNIGKTSRALELGHWETSRVLELGGALGNESRARVGAFRNSRPRARMILCRDDMTGNILILRKTLYL